MKLDFSIGLGQRQCLTLTAQVQQAIKLLQMTNLEVNEYIEENFAINPFVELKDKLSQDTSITPVEAKAETTSTAKSLEDTPFGSEKPKTKTEIENQFETGDSFKTKSTVTKEKTDFNPIELMKSHEKSLYVHCVDYIERLSLSVQERLIAYRLLEELAPTGWIDVTVDEIANQNGSDKHVVESVLDTLKMIEPAGLFSRTLAECLRLQAQDANILDDNLDGILNNLHLLGSGKFDLLKRRCGCTDEEMSKNLTKIQSLLIQKAL